MKKLFKNRFPWPKVHDSPFRVRNNNTFIVLILILILSFIVRVFGYNWDGQSSFHPDERMIGFVVDRLDWDFQNFFSPISKMNPNFFAYGSFPIYLLWIIRQIVEILSGSKLTFDNLLNLGRIVSACFDTITVLLIFLLTKKLFGNKKLIALLAAFSYSISVLPIQLSHYFAVDTVLTCGIMLSIYLATVAVKTKNLLFLLLLGGCIGTTVATKITGGLVILPIVFYLFYSEKRGYVEKSFSILTVLLTGLLAFFITMPYVLIDWTNFWEQISQQSKLYSDAYVFPYTLQYVGTLPYLYFLKNIFLWGIGPIAGCFGLLGLAVFVKKMFQRKIQVSLISMMILFFAIIYFAYMGFSQVKFMRYMLPIYPMIAISVGAGIFAALSKINRGAKPYMFCIIFAALIFYPMSFINTYTLLDTRSQATNWILKNIPKGSKIATEHWDDRVPIIDNGTYNFLELKLYDQPDDSKKWETINKQLLESDYLVIASNRLYKPIQKLTGCNLYKTCYPIASKYYEDLFSNRSQYKKIAEFSSHPKVPLLNLIIDDAKSDESFNVYERPTIMIFKKDEE